MDAETIQEHAEVVEKLKEIPALRFFEKKDLKRIFGYSKITSYKPNDCIITEGSFDNCIYFLIMGRVKIIKQGEEISHLERTGDIFGEMCVIDGCARSATVIAVDDTTCLTTDVSFVDSMNPADKLTFSAIFYNVLSVVLAERLRETSAELARLKDEMEEKRGT